MSTNNMKTETNNNSTKNAKKGLRKGDLILLGILFAAGSEFSYTMVYLGIACFSLSLVFQLVTLPVEFNASRRAMAAIGEAGIFTEEEQVGAKKTLSAAAMTYVAATAVALAQILRLLVLFGGRRRRD